MTPDDLVTAGQIARMLQVSPGAVTNWQTRGDTGFPEPWGQWSKRFKLWKRSDVEMWAAERAAETLAAREKAVEYHRAELARLGAPVASGEV